MNLDKYYLGIDGGGTKTEFLLCDGSGRVINNYISGGCNPNDIGIEECLDILKNGCREACKAVPYEKISVFAGIAGVASCCASDKIMLLFKEIGFSEVGCASDTALVVAMTCGNEDGITVIMGTGIVVIVNKSGEQKLLGGYNYFFDNGGSGFNIGRDAVRYALLCEERNMPKTPLYYTVLSKCKSDTVRKNLGNFYKYGKKYVAQFARCVTETIHIDIHSAEIFDNNMSCVADTINYAFTLLDGANRVYITGGLTSQKELIIEYLGKYLYKDNTIEFVDKKTVIGALMLAGLEAEIC